MMTKNIKAERLLKLPSYMFAEFDRKRDEVKARCNDLIDLSIGDPDLQPATRLKRYLKEALNNPGLHRYPPYKGTRAFCQAVSQWHRRKNIAIDPDSEIWSLIGSKEGIVHLIMALVNPGEAVLLPDPYFPCYLSAIIMAGGIPVHMPLLRENNFLPDLNSIKPSLAKKAKLMLLNYPNNPTSADAPKEFYQEAVRFAKKYGLVICQDAAYQEIYSGRPAVSILQVKGAKDVAVEMNSFSKTLNIAGWRIGWAAGNKRIIEALAQIKTNTDSGVFMALQQAVTRMLTENFSRTQAEIARTRAVYRRRQNIVLAGLRRIGLNPITPDATCFIWLPLPHGWRSSLDFCEHLLAKFHVHTTPGLGFGKYGEGYIRISLTSPDSILRQAVKRFGYAHSQQ
jgi:LL-diaminopimelate aminotransferase